MVFCCFSAALLSFAAAEQAPEEAASTELSLLELQAKTDELYKKNEKIPLVSMESVKQLAEQAGKSTNPRFLRVLAQKQRTKALKLALANGKIRSFPDIVENWPAYQTQLAKCTTLHQEWTETEDAQVKLQLHTALLDSLQPLKHVLKSATHANARVNKLSKSQQAQQARLDTAFNQVPSLETVSPASASQLKLVTSAAPCTLTFLSVPIVFEAPAGTEIILSSTAGGLFANNLSKIRIVADEQGRASTLWMSHGDGVADCEILYRSPAMVGKSMINPIVKRLELMNLTEISPVVEKVASQH